MARERCKWNKTKTVCTKSGGFRCTIKRESTMRRTPSAPMAWFALGYQDGKALWANPADTKEGARKICRKASGRGAISFRSKRARRRRRK